MNRPRRMTRLQGRQRANDLANFALFALAACIAFVLCGASAGPVVTGSAVWAVYAAMGLAIVSAVAAVTCGIASHIVENGGR